MIQRAGSEAHGLTDSETDLAVELFFWRFPVSPGFLRPQGRSRAAPRREGVPGGARGTPGHSPPHLTRPVCAPEEATGEGREITWKQAR